MTTLTSFFKTDLVDDHTANDVNVLIAAALRPEYANTETISATKTLTDSDTQFQFLTASGADRTVKLAPEATSNHVTVIYNSGASQNIVVQDDSATYTFATLAPDEWVLMLPLNAEGWRVWKQPEDQYKLSVTVSANDLIVALKHLDDTDPTVYRPICIVIAGVKRYVTAATSITLADATNWFNAGSAELATKEIDYFTYAIWDSNSSVVAIAPARFPSGRLVSDFSATTTNEKYLGNYANYTSTDPVKVIGRFAATLSAGAGYTWTVPTFTNLNLIHIPVFKTRSLTWVPAWTNLSVGDGTVTATYQIIEDRLYITINLTFGSTTSISGSVDITFPFSRLSTAATALGPLLLQDTGTANYLGDVRYISATVARLFARNASGTYETWSALSSTVPHTWANTDVIASEYQYGI